MATITINIRDNKATDLLKYAKKMGGRIVAESELEMKADDDGVTHGEFFGENIRRAIDILRKH